MFRLLLLAIFGDYNYAKVIYGVKSHSPRNQASAQHTEHKHDNTKGSTHTGLGWYLWTGSSEDYKATNLSLNSLNNARFPVFKIYILNVYC